MIAQLGKRYACLAWWVSGVSERNPKVSSLFLNSCYLKLACEILEDRTNNLCVVAENCALLESIGKMASSPLSSNLNLAAYARYFSAEGEQLGRGPLPPRVGKTTKYIIFMEAINTIHPLESVVAHATLPLEVQLTKTIPVEGGSLSFDEKNRTLTWSPKKIPPHLGKYYEPIGIIFELALTPSEKTHFKEAELLTQISITGRDTITEENLSKNIPPITTRLLYDKKAKGKEIVQ